MSIIRNKLTKKFTTIPNQIIIDTKLSHGAFRVYAYLVSKYDGWKVINSDIQAKLNIKQAQTLANFWKELLATGWITRYRIKDATGKITGGFDYELNEFPVINNIEPAKLGSIHNVESPQYGESVDRENPQYINKTKEQECTNTDLKNTNPLFPFIRQTNEGSYQVWLEQVKQLGYSFTTLELDAIKEWAAYKIAQSESISIQQIILTLKALAAHKLARYDIVYMIHQSITGGYRKIMDPTYACLAKPVAKVVNSTYSAKHYIVPQNEAEKNELWNYIKCCYISKNDPRTGEPMTKEQACHVGKHFKFGLSKGISQEEYILLNEVETGISLLEQAIKIV